MRQTLVHAPERNLLHERHDLREAAREHLEDESPDRLVLRDPAAKRRGRHDDRLHCFLDFRHRGHAAVREDAGYVQGAGFAGPDVIERDLMPALAQFEDPQFPRDHDREVRARVPLAQEVLAGLEVDDGGFLG